MAAALELASPWLVRLKRPREAAKLRLICLPHSGGAAFAFRGWGPRLPENIELFGVEYPGRSSRAAEPPLRTMEGLVEGMVDALRSLDGKAYAFFGHSLGATLAFEVTRSLAVAGMPLPLHLFVSGTTAPHYPWPGKPVDLSLPDYEFMLELSRRFGGVRQEVLDEPELVRLVAPVLKADLGVGDRYEFRSGAKLALPMTVFSGASDADVDEKGLRAWGELTTGRFGLRMFPGGHFYVNDQEPSLVASVVEVLTPFLRSHS